MRSIKLKSCPRIAGLHFRSDGRQMLVLGSIESGGIDDLIWLDVASGEVLRKINATGHGYDISADFKRLVVGSEVYPPDDMDTLLRWIDPSKEGEKWHPLSLGEYPDDASALMVGSLALSPDGKRLIVCHGIQTFQSPGSAVWTNHVTVFNPRTGKASSSFERDNRWTVMALASDGTLAVCTERRPRKLSIELLELEKYGVREKAEYRVPGTQTRYLLFSPDGSILAVANARVVYLLSAVDLKLLAELRGHSGQVNALAFTADGRKLFSASHDGGINEWDVGQGRLLRTYDWEIGPVTALAMAPDGLTCAVGGKGGQIVIWDVE